MTEDRAISLNNCDTCLNNNESWDSDSCDGCCKNHSNYDRAISLNAVIDVMHEMWGDSGELLDAIEELPPVTPQFYPPCEDCNKKMDEIRKASDKLQDREEVSE